MSPCWRFLPLNVTDGICGRCYGPGTAHGDLQRAWEELTSSLEKLTPRDLREVRRGFLERLLNEVSYSGRLFEEHIPGNPTGRELSTEISRYVTGEIADIGEIG